MGWPIATWHGRARLARSLLGALAVASTACTSATELIVVVDSDLPVPSALDRVDVVVVGPTSQNVPLVSDLRSSSGARLPLTLGVTPAGDSLGPVSVIAVGYLDGREVVRREARTTLIRGESRVLWIVLRGRCVGTSCPAGRTCGDDGACVDIDVPAHELPLWEGRIPSLDAATRDARAGDDLGGSGEAGTPDAARDGGDLGPDAGRDADVGPPSCPPSCDDGVRCTIDRCDVIRGVCVHEPDDIDDDGHGDEACGGQDCDDADDAVFPGAVELCNGSDDDCDGTIDEGCPCMPLGASEACTTDCGSMGSRVFEASGWADCVPPMETCNGLDDDCDGHPDEGLDYAVLGPSRRLTSDASDSIASSVAWQGSHFVVVWQDTLLDGDGVYLATVDRAGAVLLRPTFVGEDGEDPTVAWTGAAYAVGWREQVSCGFGCSRHPLFVSVVGLSGTSTRAPENVYDNASSEAFPQMLWLGGTLSMSFSDDHPYIARIDPLTAAPLGAPGRVGSRSETAPVIAALGSDIAVAWTDGDDVVYQRRSVDGGSFGGRGSLGLRSISRIAIAGSTASFFIAAHGSPDTLLLRPFGVDGSALATSAMLTTTLSGFDGRRNFALASAQAQVLAVWSDDRSGVALLYLARFGLDGTMLQAPTALGASTLPSVMPSAVWSGDELLVAWSERTMVPPGAGGGELSHEIATAIVGCR